jgi:hypothetical protein
MPPRPPRHRPSSGGTSGPNPRDAKAVPKPQEKKSDSGPRLGRGRIPSPIAAGALGGLLLGGLLLLFLASAPFPARSGFALEAWAGLRPALAQSLVLGVVAYALLLLSRRLPVLMAAAGLGLLLVIPAHVAFYFGPSFTRGFIALLLVLFAWLGASVGGVFAARRSGSGPSRRWVAANAFAALGSAGLTLTLLVGPGGEGGTLAMDRSVGPPAPWIGEANPGTAGPHTVLEFTYGSGTTRGRTEYGPGAALHSPRVDLTTAILNFRGDQAERHAAHWGFDLSRSPLNAHVWMPQGVGPFPVVVALPGHHPSRTESELGLRYLGELLASRGFVFVSIEQAFLNGPWIANGAQEMPGRAHLALHHLRQLAAWNRQPDTPFSGNLDLERVALLGHSRGGEAAAAATELNRMSRLPEEATIPLDFNLGIRAVVALAPTDGLYRPSGRAPAPTGIDYLVLHGSFDGDVSAFQGLNQFHRVRLPPGSDHFKAAVYVHRANHAQFNEDWSRNDVRAPLAWLLNREPVLSAETQRAITAFYVSAFLEASLNGNTKLRYLLQDDRYAGDWLPSTLYLTLYEDARMRFVSTYEENGDPTTTTVEGGSQVGTDLAGWRETPLLHRDRHRLPQENHAVLLSWIPGWEPNRAPPSYEILLPEDLAESWHLDVNADLVFAAGNAERYGDAMDFSVELVSENGEAARLPIAPLGLVPPPFQTHVWKSSFLDRWMMHGPEQLLRSYRIPLTLFVRENPDFDPTSIQSIGFHFDRTPAGAIFLDDIGFRIPEPSEAPGTGAVAPLGGP